MNLQYFFLALIEGLGITVSPCILPILPLILATSAQGNRSRPYGIITGFIGAFTILTLLSRQIFAVFPINQKILQTVSIYFLLLFGIILFSEYLSEKFYRFFQKAADYGESLSNKTEKRSGFWGGLLIGSCISLIWTPCAGPIMAAVLVQVIQQKSDAYAFMILLAFGLGVALPMAMIAVTGQRLVALSKHTRLIRKTLAVIIIASALMIQFDVWQKLLASPIVRDEIKEESLMDALKKPYKAPEFVGLEHWINSKPLHLKDLRGKVVLIDFWTYSCINCVRTLPYLKSWYQKYADKGLVIIGIHAPEFEFEKNYDNVLMAVQEHEIHYPVVLDNHLATWSHFKNQFWPAHYLINSQGEIVYTHFGEGHYDITENNIRFLLGLGIVKENSLALEKQPLFMDQSPETYLGTNRAENFTDAQVLPLHHWGLTGTWRKEEEKIIATTKNAKIRYHFKAKKVYLVMADPGETKINVYLDGQLIQERFAGKNVKHHQVLVDRHTLYELVHAPTVHDGVVEVEALSPGFEAYAFTFG